MQSRKKTPSSARSLGRQSFRRSVFAEALEPRRLMADAGNTLATATDLGTVTTNVAAADGVTAGDLDYYKFTLSTISDVNVSLDNGNVNQQILWDRNNNGLIESGETLTNRNGGIATQRLAAGSYYVLLQPNGSGGNYNMSITAAAAVADPGGSLATATDLGTVNTSVNRADWVGNADGSDVYKFTIPTISDVSVSLDNGNVYQQLIWDKNNNGIVDSGEILTGRTGGTSVQRLPAGSYYTIPSSNGYESLYYTVSITRTAAATDPSGSLSTATDLGTVTANVSASDWVGNADGSDVYKFTIPTISDVSVSLDNGNVYQQLIWDKNNNDIVDSGEILTGRTGGTSVQRLPAGTYYAVPSSNGYESLYYTVSITRTAAATDPSGSLSTATDLGTVTTSVSNADWVGNADGSDVYKFTVPTTSDVSVSLDNGNVYQQLVWDQNNNGIVDSGEILTGRTGGSVHQRLPAGSYYVIPSSNGYESLYYTVAVSRTAAAADPGDGLANATDLGQPSGATTVSDWVGAADGGDVYKFNVPVGGSVSLSLSNGNAYIQLIKDANDNKIVDSGDVLQGRTGGTITATLTAGTYYANVLSNGYSDLFYDLGITTPVVTKPVLSTLVIDNGTQQRSRVRSITLLMDDTNPLIDFAAGAFTLTQTSGAILPYTVSVASVTKPAFNKTAINLVFSGAGMVGGSVADGQYLLKVDGTKITDAAGVKLDAANNGTQGSLLQFGFTRLFGDFDGDRGVSINDFNTFTSTFGKTSAQTGYLDAADYDGDGSISINDFNAITGRIGISV